MKTKILTLAFLLTIGISYAQMALPVAALNRQWETGPGLKIPESVLYDSASGIIYVSNIDGNPATKDSTGFIATLSLDGSILNAAWVTGLHAPKGMGIINNHLFVSNIDEVVEIHIPTAAILNRYKVEGSEFLNDIAIDPETGMVFITETKIGQVYVLHGGKVSLWLQGPMFKGANGLCIRDSVLYIGTGSSVLKADIRSGEVVVCMAKTGGVDGLYATSDGKFIFSDWKGSVFMAAIRQKPEVLLNTSLQKVNAADFEIIASKNMILIPTFGNNKVVCYTSPLIK